MHSVEIRRIYIFLQLQDFHRIWPLEINSLIYDALCIRTACMVILSDMHPFDSSLSRGSWFDTRATETSAAVPAELSPGLDFSRFHLKLPPR